MSYVSGLVRYICCSNNCMLSCKSNTNLERFETNKAYIFCLCPSSSAQRIIQQTKIFPAVIAVAYCSSVWLEKQRIFEAMKVIEQEMLDLSLSCNFESCWIGCRCSDSIYVLLGASSALFLPKWKETVPTI